MTEALMTTVEAQEAPLLKIANFLAKSSLIPKHFQEKPVDCYVALTLARRLGISAFEVMQSIYFVNGRPGFAAQFAIALANTRGPFKGRIRFKVEGSGRDLKATALATIKDTGEVVTSDISWAQAEAAGWVARNPLYKSIGPQLLCYRAALALIRLHAPEVLIGLAMDSADEMVENASDTWAQREEDARRIDQQLSIATPVVSEMTA